MTQLRVSITSRLVLIAFAILTAGPSIADKPSWAGGGKPEKQQQKGKQEKQQQKGKQEKQQQKEQHYNRDDRQGNFDDKGHYDRDRVHYSGGSYFIDRQRSAIHDYYVNEYRTGRCPPGLAKKANGCLPPGQAKKWVIGRPLPRDVVFYDLPPALMSNFGPPPPGYRFVRVASDILMIAIGSGMVMDAINDLGRY